MCMGIRFALTQLKVGLVHVILNFHIKESPNQKPIVLDPQTALSYPKDGILVRFEARKQNIELNLCINCCQNKEDVIPIGCTTDIEK